MHVTQWGELGVHCAVAIAERERQGRTPVGAQEIANEHRIAVDYAQQILQRLRRGGLVSSVRGPQGGYRLARPASEITLRDILMACEGETFSIICDSKTSVPERCQERLTCGLREIWHDLGRHLETFLVAKTLEELTALQYRADTPIQIRRPQPATEG